MSTMEPEVMEAGRRMEGNSICSAGQLGSAYDLACSFLTFREVRAGMGSLPGACLL